MPNWWDDELVELLVSWEAILKKLCAKLNRLVLRSPLLPSCPPRPPWPRPPPLPPDVDDVVAFFCAVSTAPVWPKIGGASGAPLEPS